ncbi:Uncharacterized membrane-anchored protein YitT, contains DUF161 and DUF2179 domains [Caminicella sporogenes DSM 14501]|uniref:Uncharacterized membrane-anchored protein YitT, contains DUF161 and DUF2179 domains n=1 Tax=Caminicella sporogenes DSM 14501 TaxID=1121266 RepID=A0A1M6PF73_9FIRM|nr:YitT family protein [Caminicella sporogenes]RKD21422.1 hypothetical protein BET04_08265 [Caminicella sporogenes]SHK06542.1 Uncharacterized membrane-anchored protein YitT, contains DUF161 and DUF2179 domains [Caminicella sporogenes DSM 14501]
MIKDYVIVTIGVIIVALGLSFFLVPADLAVGGITGLAMVINNIFPQIAIGPMLVVMNILLFIIGFILIGKQFGIKTIYASFALSGIIWVIEAFFHIEKPLVDDMFLNLFYGILIQGIGMAIIFYQNASTGGTDIIAKILNKFFYIEIGKALLLADFMITFLAGITFGLKLGLYALLGVLMNTVIIDSVIEGLNLKINISIITSSPDKIKKFINEELKRGATLYYAEGAYTNENRTVISTVMNKKEFIRLKKFIKENDKNAFVIVSNVREVLGNGFRLSI